MDAILKYDRPKIPAPKNQAWNRAQQHVLNQFRRMDKVNVMSYQYFDDVKYLRSSSAGYGYVGLKGDPGNYERARKTAVTIADVYR